MSQAQINSLKLQNNMHCESVELKLILIKTTLSEGFCNSLITFNFEKNDSFFLGKYIILVQHQNILCISQ